jgi:hypothetical protein
MALNFGLRALFANVQDWKGIGLQEKAGEVNITKLHTANDGTSR